MALTLNDLRQEATRVIGEQPDPRIDVESIINDAGKYLFAMHPWGWRNRPEVPLAVIPQITLTDATWTESSLTITKTSAFSSYTFVPGDIVVISDGTGATAGSYEIESKTDASNIVLKKSIGSGADGQTDIDGTLTFSYVSLPDDFGFGEIISVRRDSELTNSMVASSLDQIRWMRRVATVTNLITYYAAAYPTQATTSAAPGDAILELYPAPTSTDVDAYWCSYRSGWVILSGSTVANIPTAFEPLLRSLVRAFAHKAQSGSESELNAVRGGVLFNDLVKADGRTHWLLGQTEGGHMQHARGSNWPWWYPTTVTMPS